MAGIRRLLNDSGPPLLPELTAAEKRGIRNVTEYGLELCALFTQGLDFT